MTRVSALLVLCSLAVALAVAAALEVSIGPMMIPAGRLIPDTWAYLHGARSGDAVVMGAIRWPRALAAVLVGAGLAATGAVLQAVFRNSMADPAVIGVSSGASLGAVLTIQTGLAQLNAWSTPVGAFVTGLLVVYVIYRLATLQGKTAIHALLLAGVAVGSFSSAMVTLLLSLAPLETMQQMLFWLMGGLDGTTWMNVWMILVFVAGGFVVYLWHAHALDILSLGEEQAEGLGVPLQRTKQVLFATSALVVGACVSVSGVIAFVGLIVPHLVRMWVGPRHRLLLPASAMGGGILLALADVLARMVLQPVELNVGVVTSCLGAPFFLYLLRRHYQAFERGAKG
ncbi:FecCD family ABC transporter permease [Alicyclobacillus shizuokensis]|uniref:FecCD family ABC transporter permease n=1 Tax=Alicyclobacillus shizuokensis TaxID=392014 RepID=UPI0008333F42|nr:iron ABC transporter permease [Alicyclobacillus shizuokensis]